MKLLTNIKSCCGVFGVTALLCSCSSAVFPDVIEDGRVSEDSSFTTRKSSKIEMSVPEESNSLKSDEKNAAYEYDEEDDGDLEEGGKADIKPVKKEDLMPEEEKSDNTVSDTFSEDERTEVKDTAADENIFAAEEPAAPSVSYRIDTFYFANGSSVLDSQYNSRIRKIVKEAKANNAYVKVLGFASSRTRNTDIVSHKLANFKVSAERADSVANALKRNGLAADKIETEALSDSNPAYLEVMPEGERLNRRVEVYIVY